MQINSLSPTVLSQISSLASPQQRKRSDSLAQRFRTNSPSQNRETIPTSFLEATKYLYIRTKDRRVVPLDLNDVQVSYREARGDHHFNLILKARQFGFSTLTAAEYFHNTITVPGTYSMVVAQDDEAAEGLFHMVKLMHDRLPDAMRPVAKYANKRQFYFPELESWYTVGTAGGKSTGRSKTINNLHCSELAYWPNGETVLAGLLEAVPEDGFVTIESTAANYGDYYHQRYNSAKTGDGSFQAYFFPWFFHADYKKALPAAIAFEPTEDELKRKERAQADYDIVLSNEQMAWHRQKRADNERWASEYPSNDLECFISSGRPRFNREKLLDLKNYTTAPKKLERNGVVQIWKGPRLARGYVIGADPAEGTVAGDMSAAYVLDWLTLETVAKVHGRLGPNDFAVVLDELGRRYNDALLVVERNNHGHAVLLALDMLAYPNLYRHQPFDPTARDQNVMQKLGWPASESTKAIAVSRLDEALNADALNIYDEAFIEEAVGYVYLPNGKVGAQSGQHDDLISAMYVALEGHSNWLPPTEAAEVIVPTTDPWR